jgi:ubiquinone/menaquinone biosynthesis C-methylase UbiE
MSLSGRLFAATYDQFLKGTEKAGLSAQRDELLAAAHGRVLEVGAGTGLNLAHYPRDAELTLTEPEGPMLSRLERRVREQRPDATVLQAPVEDLPFEDDSFDVVVATLTLCTVRDQARALAEVRRVLRPGGALLVLEHVRSDDARSARLQDRVNGLNKVVAHGCNCNRPTVDALRAAGFTVDELRHGELPKAPPFVRPLVVGTAVAS